MSQQQIVEDLTASVDEVLDNVRAVRGEAFAAVVMSLFELGQAVAALGHARGAATGRGVDLAPVVQPVVVLAANGISRLAHKLLDAESVKEATDIANTLMATRTQAQRRLVAARQQAGGES